MRAIQVHDVSQVAEARRAAVTAAQALGFCETDAGRVAVVATELTTNVMKHGGGGTFLVGSYEDETGAGVECLAIDRGPGIIDVHASARDGHSTAGSSGNGLGAILRGAHCTDIYSLPGLGTAILARLQPGAPGGKAPPSGASPGWASDGWASDGRASDGWASHGAVNVAVAGEESCGDSWCRRGWEGGVAVMVADGLGHGPHAAEASLAAVQTFAHDPARLPSETLAAMHSALRPTRGAAVAIARVDHRRGEIQFGGVGNIAATIVEPGQTVQRMISNNGTIGHIARHMKDFTYPFAAGSLMILASDGLGTSWRLESYPGLVERHPSLIAGVLYRDFSRNRDDVTIVVCRLGHA